MLGDHRDHALGAVGGPLGDERPDLGVLARPDRLRQRRVGDVADQHVLEGVLALAGEPAARGRHDQVLVRAATRASSAQVEPVVARVADRALPEGLADDRGACSTRRSGARQRVEPGREHRVDGLGQRLGARCAPSSRIRLTISSANSGLPPERSATWLGELGRRAVAARRAARATSSRACSRAERLERDRRRVQPAAAPARAGGRAARRGPGRRSAPGPRAQRARCSIRSSIPSSAQWMSSTAKTSGSRRLAASTSVRTAGEQALAHLLRVLELATSGAAPGRRLDAERAPERGGEPLGRLLGLRVRDQLLDPAWSLLQAALGVVGVDDLERPADDLAERPVGEPGAVGGAAAEPDGGRRLALADAASRARAAAATCRPRPARSR